MKFIVSTIEEIDGKPLFKEAYRSTVECKNIHGQEFTEEVCYLVKKSWLSNKRERSKRKSFFA